MVRLVLFDIDGTLLHTNSVGLRAFAKTLETEFKILDGIKGMKFSGRTDTGIVREIFGRQNVPPTPANFELFFDIYAHWLAHLLEDCRGEICPGGEQLIRALQALPKAPAIGLLTGNIRLGAELKLRHFNLWNHFTTGAFADDREDRNEIAAVARERGGKLLGEKLRGDQVVVIGDTPLDIACGRAIGAKVLAVATGGSTLEELKEHRADWTVKDLTHISAAEICR